MITEMQPGTFPVFERGLNQMLFVQHPQATPLHVVLPDGTRKLSGYVKVAHNLINLYALCQTADRPSELVIEEIVYVDDGDNLKRHVIEKMAPTVLDKESHQVGYVTKLVGQRWGFNLSIDTETGGATIKVDTESPILGLKLRFQ